MITASSHYRDRMCPGNRRLEHIQETTELTEEGRAVHAFLAALPDALTGAGEAEDIATKDQAWVAALERCLFDVPDKYRARVASLDLEPIRALLEPGGFHREQSMLWAPGRRFTCLIDTYRGAVGGVLEKGVDLIGMTPDLWTVQGDLGIVGDWKGRHPDGPALITQVEDYAAGIADLMGLRRMRCFAVAFPEDGEPRIIQEKDGAPWILEAWDLDAIAERAVADLEAQAKPDAPLHTGPWCGNCPARHACPARGAKLAWALELARKEGDATAFVQGATDAQIFELRDAVLAPVKRAIEELEEEIRARASRQPIRHEGRVLGIKEQLGAGSINAVMACELAKEEGHPIPEVEVTTTKAAIAAAVGQTAPKRGKTRHVQAFLDRLDARGGIRLIKKLTEWKEDNHAGVAGVTQEALSGSTSPPGRALDSALVISEQEVIAASPLISKEPGALAAWAEARAAERKARIAACSAHKWSSIGDCFHCGVMRGETLTDKSTGHPIRSGERLCSCGPEAKDCVDREVAP